MNIQTLSNILVAVSVAHAFHSTMEPVNIRSKVARLAAYMDKKPFKEIPVNIDTRAKALGIGYGMFAVLTLLIYGLSALLNPSTQTAITLAVVLMIIVEILNTFTIDKYHVEIEAVTRRFKK